MSAIEETDSGEAVNPETFSKTIAENNVATSEDQNVEGKPGR